MSRTYRKTNKWCNSWWMPEEWQILTNEEKYRQHRDGTGWKETKWHFKQIHRIGRAIDREQFAKLRKCEDLEEFSFDPSKHIKSVKVFGGKFINCTMKPPYYTLPCTTTVHQYMV